jgi:hypothetical protein
MIALSSVLFDALYPIKSHKIKFQELASITIPGEGRLEFSNTKWSGHRF